MRAALMIAASGDLVDQSLDWRRLHTVKVVDKF
jgi:hypothetical protein